MLVTTTSSKMEVPCSSQSCTQPSKYQCSGCRTTQYCSKACQTASFPTHKLSCTGLQKHKCFIIHAAPASNKPVLENIAAQIEPFELQSYGNEQAEIRELKQKLGWKNAEECANFYDHKGTDTWWYFAYGEYQKAPREHVANKPLNEISTRTCYMPIYGDIVIVRTGPLGTKFEESFLQVNLVKTIEWYRTTDCKRVYTDREQSRFCRRMGINPSVMRPNVYGNIGGGGFSANINL